MTVDERKAEIARLRKELPTAAEDRKAHLAFWDKEHARCILSWMSNERRIEAAYMRRQRKTPAEIKAWLDAWDADMDAVRQEHGLARRAAA